MRNNKLVMGAVIIIAIIGFVLVTKALISMGKGKKQISAMQSKGQADKAAMKKIIAKGKGALTVKIQTAKKVEVPMRVKIFRTMDSKSSVYNASTVGSRMQELVPGTYDIEVDTVPQKIFKNIKVNEGKETIEDLGCVSGSLMVKTINSKKAPAYFPLRILYSKTNEMVTAFMTNRTLELVPGVYDIEIGTSPRQYKKDVKIEAGKENIIDLGCLTGTLLVRVVDTDKKDVRCNVRITRADTNEVVSMGASNKPMDLGKGKYNIDIMTTPRQYKKDVAVNQGEEQTVEFVVTAAPAAQKAAPKAAVKK